MALEDKPTDSQVSVTEPERPNGVAPNGISNTPNAEANSVNAKIAPKSTYKPALEYATEYVTSSETKIDRIEHSVSPPTESREGGVPVLELVSQKTQAGDELTTFLRIFSPMLVNTLRSVVQDVDVTFEKVPSKLPEPYWCLFRHEEQLRDFMTNHPTTHSPEYQKECNEHIQVLLRFMKEQAATGRGLEREVSRWKRKTPTATFQYLWALWKAGEIVLLNEHNRQEPYVVDAVTGGVEKGVAKPYKITLWNFDCNGEELGRSIKDQDVEIRPFDGEVDLRKLKIFPARYHPEWDDTKASLIARGRKFYDIVKGVSHKEYTGETISGPKQTKSDTRGKPERKSYKNARVVVDYRFRPWLDTPISWHYPRLGELTPGASSTSSCLCHACVESQEKISKHVRASYDGWDSIKLTEPLGDDQLLLCPREVYAYILRERKWAVLDIDALGDPSFNQGIMKSLVMKEDNKKIIEAICREYTLDGPEASSIHDIVANKGQGRIFLLHGPPGVGKTLTAECVAEYTCRPLLTITAGDVGADPLTVESNLDNYFEWAEEWRAILLLDEADVYLERRGRNDLKRNSIVSVFLRALEYYSGILFITTNRVGTFDEAFKSRIHIPIWYKPFDEDMRRSVWDRIMDRLVDENGDKYDLKESVRRYVKESEDVQSLNWNGRQIRNGFQTAVTLADYDAKGSSGKVVIEKAHLERVMQMSKAFEIYLHTTHKVNDSTWAKHQQYRVDDFNEDDQEMFAQVVIRSVRELAQRKACVGKEQG